MASTIAEVTIDLTVEGQPEVCKRLQKCGWRFEFEPESGYVFAEHKTGGRFAVGHVDKSTMSRESVAEIGTQIAMLLIGGNHNAGK